MKNAIKFLAVLILACTVTFGVQVKAATAITSYTFNLRNLERNPVEMWLFLDSPQFSQDPGEIFQNSNTFLEIPPYTPEETQKFVAHVQYKLEATQQNEPVGLDTYITSDFSKEVDLKNGYLVEYSSDKGGYPTIEDYNTSRQPTSKNLIAQTNKFEPVPDYYNALTFGVTTTEGTTGVTWEPEPNIDYTITPTLTFYIATGEYQENVLAQIDATSAENAKITTGYGGDFNNFNNVWVTYNQDGTWTVENQPWQD
ncbi:MAG: hypothetical protein F6K40_06585 [Okeania sp. SIO3I5]|uniref:hypothetical protein n=1 Tax=Okeania sp. SIO3I5 TaxID=2607805 RepID=UPI0013B9A3F5|nr:hypothetical protein [Okeania sp. SIO3I5]NEQ35968.1 hypothetical protein [Okeania sp. SIO3I5]